MYILVCSLVTGGQRGLNARSMQQLIMLHLAAAEKEDFSEEDQLIDQGIRYQSFSGKRWGIDH